MFGGSGFERRAERKNMKIERTFGGLPPYEKFLKQGPEVLSEAELLAIILRTGTCKYSALELGEKVLALFKGREDGLNGLHHISLKELMDIPGIGEVKAVKLKCIAELAIRMAKEKASVSLCFNSPGTVAEYYMERMRHEEKEKILLLLLDSKLRLLEEAIVSVGTINASLLSSRDVFIKAIRSGASNLMLLHNHPSGDPSPSTQDIWMTKKMKEAGELMDIPLIDHIILGDGCYISFKEANQL